MTQLIDALRAKYRTPQAAMAALGIDEALLRDGKPMKLTEPLHAAAKAGLKELLGMDATLMDVIQFIDALKQANPTGGEEGAPGAEGGAPKPGAPKQGAPIPPEETDDEYDHEEPTKDEHMTTAPNSGLPVVGGGMKKKAYDNEEMMTPGPEAGMATDNPAARLHSLLSEHLPPEAMAEVGEILASIAGEADEGEHEVDEAEAGLDEEPDEIKDNEEKKDMKGAMDAAISEAIKAERANSRAIIDALREVRPVVGELAMAFDSANGVFRQALKMRGIDASKVQDPEALRLLWENLPKPSASAPRQPFAMDATALDSYSKLFPSAAHIGRV